MHGPSSGIIRLPGHKDTNGFRSGTDHNIFPLVAGPVDLGSCQTRLPRSWNI